MDFEVYYWHWPHSQIAIFSWILQKNELKLCSWVFKCPIHHGLNLIFGNDIDIALIAWEFCVLLVTINYQIPSVFRFLTHYKSSLAGPAHRRLLWITVRWNQDDDIQYFINPYLLVSYDMFVTVKCDSRRIKPFRLLLLGRLSRKT